MILSVEDRLARNKYFVNEGVPHIELDPSCRSTEVFQALVNACPAGLYRFDGKNEIEFDYAGCLECGTCRIIGLGTALLTWEYPEGAFGVEYRYG